MGTQLHNLGLSVQRFGLFGQKGFGCFSYSHSHVDAVYHYIRNQEKHHQRISFREEYISMLEKFEVDYDERFIFEELK